MSDTGNIWLLIGTPFRIESQKLSLALSIFITRPDSQNFKAGKSNFIIAIISALAIGA